MPDDVRIDPEFKSLIPPLSEEERAGLEDKIKREGCTEKLKAWKNDPDGRSIIDGHNRYDICERLGVGYSIADMEFPDREAVKLWMLEHQLGRRNLTDDQRAVIARQIQQQRSEIEKRARGQKGSEAVARDDAGQFNRLSANVADKRSDKAPPPKKGRGPKKDSRAAAAKDAKVSVRKVRDVADIERDAPDLIAGISAGTISIKKARQIIRQRQKAAVAEKAKAADPLTNEGSSDAPLPDAFDLIGHPLPPDDDIRLAFANGAAHHGAALDLLTQLARLINPIVGDANKKKPIAGGEHTADERQHILTDLKNLRTALTQTRPHGVCPYCQSLPNRRPKCVGCKGLGWVAKGPYEAAPADMRAALDRKPERAA